MRALVSEYIDKKQGFAELQYIDQIMYMAYFFVKTSGDEIFTSKNIKDIFELAHLTQPQNISDLINQLCKKKVFVPNKNGYVLQRDNFLSLEKEFLQNTPKSQISRTLRELLPKIKNQSEKDFLEEVIKCYEIDAYRSSIIMTWLLVMDHLIEYILSHKLKEFNNDLKNRRWKMIEIKDKDDFSELKESQIIEICRATDIISNNTRKILEEKLGIRNSYAHPNNLIITPAKTTAFIEDLIENVLLKF